MAVAIAMSPVTGTDSPGPVPQSAAPSPTAAQSTATSAAPSSASAGQGTVSVSPSSTVLTSLLGGYRIGIPTQALPTARQHCQALAAVAYRFGNGSWNRSKMPASFSANVAATDFQNGIAWAPVGIGFSLRSLAVPQEENLPV